MLWRSKGLGDSPSSPAAAAAAAPTSVTYPDPAAAAAAAAPPVTVAAPPTNGFNRRDSYTAQQNERAIVNKRKVSSKWLERVDAFKESCCTGLVSWL